MLEKDEELNQQQKNLICFFIFPHCASKQKQMVYIGKQRTILGLFSNLFLDTPLYEPRYSQRAIRFCASNAKMRIQECFQ